MSANRFKKEELKNEIIEIEDPKPTLRKNASAMVGKQTKDLTGKLKKRRNSRAASY